MTSLPLITIITVSFNSEKFIRKAIESVINQTYKNIEYIIIDGGSTDNTIHIIEKYQEYISYWISEPDRGIYNAMNKGVSKSTGEFIYFLNSDDYLNDSHVIFSIAKNIKSNIDVIYGNVMIYDARDGYCKEFGKEITFSGLRKGIMPPHQGLFMRRSVFLELGLFNEKYSIASDFDLITKCYIGGYNFSYLNRVIAVFRIGGVSSKSSVNLRPIFEDLSVIRCCFTKKCYLIGVFWAYVKIIKSILVEGMRYLHLLTIWRSLKFRVQNTKTKTGKG